MPDFALPAIIFVLSLAVLVKSADIFTGSASRIGRMFGMPGFLVGATIVALGTSLPELASNLAAIHAGETEIVTGNVLGSNIANILLVLGVGLLFAKKLVFKKSLADLELPLLGGATALLVLAVLDGVVTRGEAGLLLAGYGVYAWAAISTGRTGLAEIFTPREKFSAGPFFVVLISAGVVAGSAKFLIDSLVELGGILGIAPAVIAATAVAVGTSLPELLVSIAAIRRGEGEMALGNIIGSNVFNIFVVVGLPGLFTALAVAPATLAVAVPFLIAATAVFILSGIERDIWRFEGLIYLLIYAMFVMKLIAG